jgi:3-deoxy-7-phosphoheptulonate synthase
MWPQEWAPHSWRKLPAFQQPIYPDQVLLERVTSYLSSVQGVVDEDSIEQLKLDLSRLYESSNEVLIHAGDCAEAFESCHTNRIDKDASFLSSLGGSIVIGRICGQFAKPRSNPVELHDEYGELPVYRGDIINGSCPSSRNPDPNRMTEGYRLASKMYNFIVEKNHDIYVSHECLLLPYEEALVRRSRSGTGFYASTAHFVWIGDRTRDLNGAHIEFCRGIVNPIGIKVGPSSNPERIRACIERLNPSNIPGKISIITRYGAGKVQNNLSALIDELQGLNVLYQCDPMHGNTVLLKSGKKTRYIESIKAEIAEVASIHRNMGSRLHGLHLEATSDSVTECLGVDVNDVSLPNYRSLCDPRLNIQQTRHVVEFFYSVSGYDSPGKNRPQSPSLASRLTTAESSRSGSSPESSDEDVVLSKSPNMNTELIDLE